MIIWYQVYEEDKRGSNKEHTLAFTAFKYTADTVARYFPLSKIRRVMQLNTWEWNEKSTTDELAQATYDA
jgi:hypothetical protein